MNDELKAKIEEAYNNLVLKQGDLGQFDCTPTEYRATLK